MRAFDLSLPSPAENLACDEALLEACENGEVGESLRFWQTSTAFIVLGYGNSARSEANLDACREHGVPILRRVSGGGSVLQAPGCLNYALILRVDRAPRLANIPATNAFVMERHQRCLTETLRKKIEWLGNTDLAIAGRKFSGNAQRRKRVAILFHGTFLLHADFSLMQRLLSKPSRQPEYRGDRDHQDFLINLEESPEAVKAALKKAWAATEEGADVPMSRIRALVEQQYGRDEWNLKF